MATTESALEGLIERAGSWRGVNVLQDPTTGRPDESEATATITSVLHGRFVRLDYTWKHQGAPQEGSVLIGYDPVANAATGYWIDSWHMGRAAMLCHGFAQTDTLLTLRGTYAAPPGPDWGWRIDIIDPSDARSLRMVMYNIWPDGREDLAVEAIFERA